MNASHLDSWAKGLIVDPLSKAPLSSTGDKQFLLSGYGRKYPVVNGIYDLRILNNSTTADQRRWKEGQVAYEMASSSLAKEEESFDFGELKAVRKVYDQISIEGACLDVGGHQGRMRAFLSPEQKYICCDPFLDVFQGADQRKNLLEVYPFLLEPMNFVCCEAEFLPFKSLSFDTVHMRSVLDHFLNPGIALNEAFRVLKENGKLIIEIYVVGGENGKTTVVYKVKESTKSLLSKMGFERFCDYHVWHPTYDELKELVENSGFRIDKVIWQEGCGGNVCYMSAVKKRKSQGFMVSIYFKVI